MLCQASGSLLGLLSLVFIVEVYSVESKSSSDVKGFRRIVKRAANPWWTLIGGGSAGRRVTDDSSQVRAVVDESQVRAVAVHSKEPTERSITTAASDGTPSPYLNDELAEMEGYDYPASADYVPIAENEKDAETVEDPEPKSKDAAALASVLPKKGLGGSIIEAETDARPVVNNTANNSSARPDNAANNDDADRVKDAIVVNADAAKSVPPSVENAAHKAGDDADSEGAAVAAPEAGRDNSIDGRSREGINWNLREYNVSIGASLKISLPFDEADKRFILVGKGRPSDYVITGFEFKPRVSGWRYSNENDSFAIIIANVSVQDSGTYYLQFKKFEEPFVINVVKHLPFPTPTPSLAIRATPTSAPTLAVPPTFVPTPSNVVDRKANESQEAEMEPREPEIFFDHELFHQEVYGLPQKLVVGSKKGFTFQCADPHATPIVKPADHVKLIQADGVWLYRVEFTAAFKTAGVDIRSISLWCVAEYKTLEYYHRNISVWNVDLDYPPSYPKTEMASKVAEKPEPSCGSTRVSCSAPANPPANWTLNRVTLNEVDEIESLKPVNVSEECVVRDSFGFRNSTFRVPPKTTFYTQLTGEFACVAKNEYGKTRVRFAIPHADYTAVVVVIIIILVIVVAILLQRYFVRIKNARKRQQRRSSTEGQYHLEENRSEKSEAPKLANTDQDIAGTNL